MDGVLDSLRSWPKYCGPAIAAYSRYINWTCLKATHSNTLMASPLHVPDDVLRQIFGFATSLPRHIQQYSYLDNDSAPDTLKWPPQLARRRMHVELANGPTASTHTSPTSPRIRVHREPVVIPQLHYRDALLAVLPTKRSIVHVCRQWYAVGIAGLYREIAVGGRTGSGTGSGVGRLATLERAMVKAMGFGEEEGMKTKVKEEPWNVVGATCLERTVCVDGDKPLTSLIRALHIRIPPRRRIPSAETRAAIARSLHRVLTRTLSPNSGALDTLVIHVDSPGIGESDIDEQALLAIFGALASACTTDTTTLGTRLRVLDTFSALGVLELSPQGVRCLNAAIEHAPNLRRLVYSAHWFESDEVVLRAGRLEAVTLMVRAQDDGQQVMLKLEDGEENRLSSMVLEIPNAAMLSTCSISDALRTAVMRTDSEPHPSLTSLTLHFPSEFVPVSNIASALHFLDASPWCSQLQTLVLRVRMLNRVYAGVADDAFSNTRLNLNMAPLAAPLIRRVRTFAIFCDEGGYVDRRTQMGMMVRALARCLEEHRKETVHLQSGSGIRLERVRLLNDLEGSACEEEVKRWKTQGVTIVPPVGLDDSAAREKSGLEWVQDVVKRFDTMGIRLEDWRGNVLGSDEGEHRYL